MRNYPFYNVDYYKDFKIFVDEISAKYKDSPAISAYNAEGELSTKTYDELAADVYALAEDLADRGLAGKHMAIVSQNSYMVAVSLLAVTYIGGVAVPIDTEQSAGGIKAMVSFADSELVFISESMLEGLKEDDIFEGNSIIILSDDKYLTDGFHEAVAHGNALISARGRKCKDTVIDPQKTAVIVYTSGTTSVSKPVMLSHSAILLNACGSIELIKFPLRMFTSLPLHHAYGLTCTLINNLVNGAEICINGDIRFMLRDFSLFKPTGLMAVPLIAEMICKQLAVSASPDSITNKGFIAFLKKASFGAEKPNSRLVAVKEKIFPGLELIMCGGAHLSPNISKALHKFGILVIEGYGITECAPLISANRNEFYKRGTVGALIPSYEIKFDDHEILVRGKCLMNGYYKHEELTKEVIVDGWFKSGDLGCIDNAGFLVITGRKKNIIVLKNGKKISPEELESILAGIPIVKEAMVYGSAVGNTADDVMPAATIYPDPVETKGMTSYEILNALQSAVDAINEDLPSFKQIRLINIREKEFPKTSTKKIKRPKQ